MSGEAMDIFNSLNQSFFETCEKIDKLWQKRRRTIDTKMVVLFLMKIITGKSKHGYGYIINEIWDSCIREKIPLPQQNPVSPSSMYEARMKLPENSIKIINENILLEWEDKSGIGMWKGHRVYAIDGSKLNVPRGLLENGYKTPKNTSRHYPYAMMSCLYDVMSGLIYDIDLVEYNNERACALKHFSRLKNNDVIIFDRGYFSYYMLHQITNNDLNVVFRIQEGNRNKIIKKFSESAESNLIFEYTPSEAVKSDLRKRGLLSDFPSIKLRLIKFTNKNKQIIFATTLLEEDNYESESIYELYHERWSIEELYKISKSILCIEDFHSHNEYGIR
ncbi:IS4 family transposase [Photorhabdus luminescens]|uniref:IS4 family transposase n=1 Tax=Photorhabdus luminescens TaxID=29488 RepID=UPI0011315B1B|nr:IS4 family transposase [Photorhabdus luminescens]